MYNDLTYYDVHNDTENLNHAFNMMLHGEKLSDQGSAILNIKKSGEPGTYIFPESFQKDFNKALAEENLFRRLGDVKDVNTSSGSIIITTSDGTAEIVDETGAFPDEDDTISEATFDSYKIASMCKMNNVFIRDKHFDIQKYLKTAFAKRFGRAEEDLFINGTGTDEPKGILASAEIGKTVVGDDFTANDLIALYFSLDKHMRKHATWVMSDETALKVKSMQDGAGSYLWKDNTLLGRPVEISNYMDDSTKPIAFGDFSYFWIIQRSPLAVKVLRELYAIYDKTGFVANERLDGRLTRPDAVKLLLLESEEIEDSE